MQSSAKSVKEYIDELPTDKQNAIITLRNTILKNLPKGFEEIMSYGMIGYVVPFSIYPNGYHVNPKLPLGFMNIGSQKNYIALYSMAIYGDKVLLEWFLKEYEKLSIGKIDMGKGCIRFKKIEKIPYNLIGELCKKVTVKQYIERYESILQTIKKTK